ncbi:hypothetical protein BK145_06600 [Paenibacillus peoriae]|nr:hypothetical protein BK119_15280 [Paenibacillus peoriae]OMF81107.1 hypothetical protein BK145_06600 [Paenibacillus peoriae]
MGNSGFNKLVCPSIAVEYGRQCQFRTDKYTNIYSFRINNIKNLSSYAVFMNFMIQDSLVPAIVGYF